MISNLNGSGSIRVHQKKAVFTGSRFRFGFGSTPWLVMTNITHSGIPNLLINHSRSFRSRLAITRSCSFVSFKMADSQSIEVASAMRVAVHNGTISSSVSGHLHQLLHSIDVQPVFDIVQPHSSLSSSSLFPFYLPHQ